MIVYGISTCDSTKKALKTLERAGLAATFRISCRGAKQPYRYQQQAAEPFIKRYYLAHVHAALPKLATTGPVIFPNARSL